MSRTVSSKSATATVVKKIDPDTPFIRDLVRRVEESHQDGAAQEIAELDITLTLTKASQEEAHILRQATITHDGTLHEENPVTFLQFTNLNKKHRLSEYLRENLLINPNEIINRKGETILHQLSQQEPSEEIIDKISRLLELGANPNIKNCHGNTPFSFACDIVEDDSTEVISLMLKYNADPFIKNNFKITPLDNCRSSHYATKQLIESYADQKLSDLKGLNKDLIAKSRAEAEKSSELEAKIAELTGQTLLLEEDIESLKSRIASFEDKESKTASENLQLELEKEKLEKDHRKAMEDQKAKLTAQHQKDIEKLRAELTAKHRRAMVDQKAKHEKDIKTLKEKLEIRHKEELAAKQSHIDTLRKELNKLLPLPYDIKKKKEDLQRLTTDNMTLHH